MEEVWRQGETTVNLVMDALNRKAKPPRAYTTYMTVMRRLNSREYSTAGEPVGRTRTSRR
jgi:predicted transcriptional regulator